MKIGIISDTHNRYQAVEAALAQLDTLGGTIDPLRRH